VSENLADDSFRTFRQSDMVFRTLKSDQFRDVPSAQKRVALVIGNGSGDPTSHFPVSPLNP
jgi:hypothetical protein